jgi:hypothetical protein
VATVKRQGARIAVVARVTRFRRRLRGLLDDGGRDRLHHDRVHSAGHHCRVLDRRDALPASASGRGHRRHRSRGAAGDLGVHRDGVLRRRFPADGAEARRVWWPGSPTRRLGSLPAARISLTGFPNVARRRRIRRPCHACDGLA